jgi:signal transduction histidine kinase/ligand-binding sensor domain-containing protein
MRKFSKANLIMTVKSFHIILLSLFTVLSKSLSAQTQNALYNFKHLTVQTGLPQNIVYHFLQDSRGYMWLGTRNGLTLYDGGHTINFLNDEQNEKSIGGNFITRLVEDPLHRVWAGTDAGVSRYNSNDNSFSNFSMLSANGKNENTFCVPLGFVNDYELWLLETKTKAIKTLDTRTQIIDSITETPAVDGVLWYDSLSHKRHFWTYLTEGTTHYVFKNKILVKKEAFFTGVNKKFNQPVFQVVHVLPQNDSVVWLSTTAGLAELNPRTGIYKLYKNRGTQTVNELRFTAIAPNGLLWAATGNNGLFTFNLKTKKFIDNYRNYRLDPFSIGSNNIVSLYFDRVGNIWCGSYGQGVSYTNVEKKYFQKDLSRNDLEKWEGNNNVRWVGYDNANNLWCIMNDAAGLWKLNTNNHAFEFHEPMLNGKKFTGRFYKLLFDGYRYAWGIGKEGLFQYDLITNCLRKMNYPAFSTDLFGSNWVQDIIRLNDQSFLFGTFAGLYRITSKNGNYTIQPFSALNKNSFTSFAALYQDETGTIYIKDLADRLYVLKNSKHQSGDPVILSVLFTPQVNQFYIDTANNSILLATNFGLYRLNRNDYTLKKVILKTAPPFRSISSLVKKDNKLWLSGEKGLFCFDEKKNTARTFTVEDGLPANEFNISAITFSADKCIAGTTNGLVSFSLNNPDDTIYSPIVQLTGIYINDAPTGFVSNPQEADKISLSHNQNTFAFDFAPIAFQNASGCSFEYKLEGYDEEWIKNGNARYTRYSKIPPGKYKFQLRVIDANGMISPHNKILEIEIAKAFWQTAFFKVVMLVIMFLAAWRLLKWYLNRKIRKHRLEFEKQQAVEQERTRIATDIHDDLGAGLSTLRFLSEKVKRNSFSEATKKDAEKIVINSNELVQKMNELIWAMNEKNDTLEDLLFYARSYAAEYGEENNLEMDICMPEKIPALMLTGELRRNIFLILKESLHNVVKHANAKKVIINFKTDKNLFVSIKDDGKGFEKTNSGGNGLKNMKKRMESIGGLFEITNTDGVMVKIIVPLK